MRWDELLVEAFSNRIRISIIKLLSSSEGMNISKIARTLGIPYSSAERNLEALKSSGIIEETRLGRVRIYKLSKSREVEALVRCLTPYELEGL